MSMAESSFPTTVGSFSPLPVLPRCLRGQGRAELFFVFKGAAAALGNDLRPSGEGTHTSKHHRADLTPLSSFLTPSISSRKRLDLSTRTEWNVQGLTWRQCESHVLGPASPGTSA